MSDPCWDKGCNGLLEVLGQFQYTETTTVEELRVYEDDAEMVLVDKSFTARVFLWECGLDRMEGTPEEIKRRSGYERWIPGK